MSAISAFKGIANCVIPPMRCIKTVCNAIFFIISAIANKLIALIGALWRKETITIETKAISFKDFFGTDDIIQFRDMGNPNLTATDGIRGFNISINNQPLAKKASEQLMSVFETIKLETLSIEEKSAQEFEIASQQGIMANFIDWLRKNHPDENASKIDSLSNENPASKHVGLLDIKITANLSERKVHIKATRTKKIFNPTILKITEFSGETATAIKCFRVHDFSMLIDLINRTVDIRFVQEKQLYKTIDT